MIENFNKPIISLVDIQRIRENLTNIYERKKNLIVDKLESFYNKKLKLLQETVHSGGQMRKKNGKFVEDFSKKAVKLIHDIYFEKKISIGVKGDDDKKEIKIRLKSEVDEHSVDIHVYLNDKLLFVIECKSYLDLCYYKRAIVDYKLFLIDENKRYTNIKFIVLAFENCVADKGIIMTNALFEVNPPIFYMLDGKRNAKKPYWKKEFSKKINKDKIKKFVEYIISLFKNNF